MESSSPITTVESIYCDVVRFFNNKVLYFKNRHYYDNIQTIEEQMKLFAIPGYCTPQEKTRKMYYCMEQIEYWKSKLIPDGICFEDAMTYNINLCDEKEHAKDFIKMAEMLQKKFRYLSINDSFVVIVFVYFCLNLSEPCEDYLVIDGDDYRECANNFTMIHYLILKITTGSLEDENGKDIASHIRRKMFGMDNATIETVTSSSLHKRSTITNHEVEEEEEEVNIKKRNKDEWCIGGKWW